VLTRACVLLLLLHPRVSSTAVAAAAGGALQQAVQLASNEAETSFFKALRSEVAKCADFFRSVEAHMGVRLGRLQVLRHYSYAFKQANTRYDL
jgi:hypothetical protein